MFLLGGNLLQGTEFRMEADDGTRGLSREVGHICCSVTIRTTLFPLLPLRNGPTVAFPQASRRMLVITGVCVCVLDMFTYVALTSAFCTVVVTVPMRRVIKPGLSVVVREPARAAELMRGRAVRPRQVALF